MLTYIFATLLDTTDVEQVFFTNSVTDYTNGLDECVARLQRRLHFSGQQKVLSKQAGSWNLILVTSYCAVCLVNQVKFCKCKSWNTTSMLKAKKIQLLNISIYYKIMAATLNGQNEAYPVF